MVTAQRNKSALMQYLAVRLLLALCDSQRGSSPGESVDDSRN